MNTHAGHLLLVSSAVMTTALLVAVDTILCGNDIPHCDSASFAKSMKQLQ